MQIEQRQLEALLEEAKKCRTRVMDDCEFEFSDSQRWGLLRSRLLRYFGSRGLEGKILEIANGLTDDRASLR
jgi:hypothetical protein